MSNFVSRFSFYVMSYLFEEFNIPQMEEDLSKIFNIPIKCYLESNSGVRAEANYNDKIVTITLSAA